MRGQVFAVHGRKANETAPLGVGQELHQDRTGLVDVFVFHGYEVDGVADGREGLERALSGRYDLILLDVMLPGMSGFDICNRVREEDRAQPIIMLTAKSDDEDVVHGLALGADDYVAKPFSVTQLVLRVQAVLRRSRVGMEREDVLHLGLLGLDRGRVSGRGGSAQEERRGRQQERC